MQRSFSIVDDDNDLDDEISLNHSKNRKIDKTEQRYSISKDANDIQDLDDSDLDDNTDNSKKYNANNTSELKTANISSSPRKHLIPQLISTTSSAGSSGRQTALRTRSISKEHQNNLSSGSELDEISDNDEIKTKKVKIPGEYDPKQYEHLDVNDEAKEIFQYITKYTPQQLDLDTKFKPFIPDFLPAVGDIDAFLKVIPPNVTLSGELFDANKTLGLVVLDEPAANQSDPALLHLQLRAASVNPTHHNDVDVIVKKVDNVEKNVKTIDKWIKDISDLHKSKSSPMVRYSDPMPDLEDLMQEWPEDMEKELNKNGFPASAPDMTLSEYVKIVCETFQIPVNKSKVQSLHLLFCLYATVKSSQLYQTSNNNNENTETVTGEDKKEIKNETDHLVLE